MKLVAKFGGSSVKNAEAFRRCEQIIASNPDISVVVVSAVFNTTNDLEMIAGLGIRDQLGAELALEALMQRHIEICSELELDEITYTLIDAIKKDASNIIKKLSTEKKMDLSLMDEMYSFGERLSSTILSSFLLKTIPERTPTFLDVRDVLVTDEHFGYALPQLDLIYERVNEIKESLFGKLVITQGFIGKSQSGNTTTLGREGSDYSATLLAEALEVELVQIWTDVAGIATVDPKLIKTAQFIKEMSYEEAALLASNGAKILFPKTLAPIKRKNIPLVVKSTFEPELPGTKINNEIKKESRITGLAIENDTLAVVGINLIEFEDKLNNFFEDFHIKHVRKEEGCMKYLFQNPSELHVALYSLHAFLFNE